MVNDGIVASELLAQYGADVSEKMLNDMLSKVQDEESKKNIKKAMLDLQCLKMTDVAHFNITGEDAALDKLSTLPPAYSMGGIDFWLFDDAIVSFNSIAKHYHGYRNVKGVSKPLSSDELKKFCQFIKSPQSILEP